MGDVMEQVCEFPILKREFNTPLIKLIGFSVTVHVNVSNVLFITSPAKYSHRRFIIGYY